jgi:hypothetical protein
MAQHSINLVAINGVERVSLLGVVGHDEIMPEQGRQSSRSVELPAFRSTTGEQAYNMLFLADQTIRMPIGITAGTRMPERIVFRSMLSTIGPTLNCQLLNRKHDVRAN